MCHYCQFLRHSWCKDNEKSETDKISRVRAYARYFAAALEVAQLLTTELCLFNKKFSFYNLLTSCNASSLCYVLLSRISSNYSSLLSISLSKSFIIMPFPFLSTAVTYIVPTNSRSRFANQKAIV